MLTEKEEKFIKRQRRVTLLLLIGAIVQMTLAVAIYVEFRISMANSEAFFMTTDKIKEQMLSNPSFLVLRAFTIGIGAGLCLGLFLLGIQNLSSYIRNKKWLGILSKLRPEKQ